MRVISGTVGGHKLLAPVGLTTRPTTDKIKESIFNMLMDDIWGTEFLDLFSGSGGMGIEAISRGAKKAFFVDKGLESINMVKKNLQKTKLMDKSEVIMTDYSNALDKFGQRKLKFDIIFLDPPYDSEYIEKALEKIFAKDLLKPKGIIILEMPVEITFEDFQHDYDCEVVKYKKYGNTSVTFLKRAEE